jgi:hypothetical protein
VQVILRLRPDEKRCLRHHRLRCWLSTATTVAYTAAHCFPDACTNGSADEGANAGTHTRRVSNAGTDAGANARADTSTDAAPVRRRLTRLRQNRGWRMLQRRRGRLLVRLLCGLLGERGVAAHMHTRDLRAHAVPDARADAAADQVPDAAADPGSDAEADEDADAEADGGAEDADAGADGGINAGDDEGTHAGADAAPVRRRLAQLRQDRWWHLLQRRG